MAYQRQLLEQLRQDLSREEIALIVGPRQVGKTFILHQLEDDLDRQLQSHFFLNLEDPDYLALLNQNPKNLLQIFPIDFQKRNYLLVDEIQYLANPSNFIKYWFDQTRGRLKILATGSSAFYLDKKFKDSLAGRKRIFTLLSLNFREFIDFKNEPELAKANFDRLTLSETEKITQLQQEYFLYGGYPKVVLAPSPEEKVEALRDLAYSYIKKDVLEGGVHQEENFYRLFKVLASQVGQLVNNQELSNTLGLARPTLENYLYLMRKSYHLAFIPPYFKNVRKELTKMPKVYFLDLGLRNFFRNDFRFLLERDDRGALVENAVFRQLVDRYSLEAIRFWRTIDQKEVDFVLENQRLAFEVKSGKTAKQSRHLAFKTAYPDIKLQTIFSDDVWKL